MLVLEHDNEGSSDGSGDESGDDVAEFGCVCAEGYMGDMCGQTDAPTANPTANPTADPIGQPLVTTTPAPTSAPSGSPMPMPTTTITALTPEVPGIPTDTTGAVTHEEQTTTSASSEPATSAELTDTPMPSTATADQTTESVTGHHCADMTDDINCVIEPTCMWAGDVCVDGTTTSQQPTTTMPITSATDAVPSHCTDISHDILCSIDDACDWLERGCIPVAATPAQPASTASSTSTASPTATPTANPTAEPATQTPTEARIVDIDLPFDVEFSTINESAFVSALRTSVSRLGIDVVADITSITLREGSTIANVEFTHSDHVATVERAILNGSFYLIYNEENLVVLRPTTTVTTPTAMTPAVETSSRTPEAASSTTVPPTASPTTSPTASPTASPTVPPTVSPTASPTVPPTASPTASPTFSPSMSPTLIPSSPLLIDASQSSLSGSNDDAAMSDEAKVGIAIGILLGCLLITCIIVRASRRAPNSPTRRKNMAHNGHSIHARDELQRQAAEPMSFSNYDAAADHTVDMEESVDDGIGYVLPVSPRAAHASSPNASYWDTSFDAGTEIYGASTFDAGPDSFASAKNSTSSNTTAFPVETKEIIEVAPKGHIIQIDAPITETDVDAPLDCADSTNRSLVTHSPAYIYAQTSDEVGTPRTFSATEGADRQVFNFADVDVPDIAAASGKQTVEVHSRPDRMDTPDRSAATARINVPDRASLVVDHVTESSADLIARDIQFSPSPDAPTDQTHGVFQGSSLWPTVTENRKPANHVAPVVRDAQDELPPTPPITRAAWTASGSGQFHHSPSASTTTTADAAAPVMAPSAVAGSAPGTATLIMVHPANTSSAVANTDAQPRTGPRRLLVKKVRGSLGFSVHSFRPARADRADTARVFVSKVAPSCDVNGRTQNGQERHLFAGDELTAIAGQSTATLSVADALSLLGTAAEVVELEATHNPEAYAAEVQSLRLAQRAATPPQAISKIMVAPRSESITSLMRSAIESSDGVTSSVDEDHGSPSLASDLAGVSSKPDAPDLSIRPVASRPTSRRGGGGGGRGSRKLPAIPTVSAATKAGWGSLRQMMRTPDYTAESFGSRATADAFVPRTLLEHRLGTVPKPCKPRLVPRLSSSATRRNPSRRTTGASTIGAAAVISPTQNRGWRVAQKKFMTSNVPKFAELVEKQVYSPPFSIRRDSLVSGMSPPERELMIQTRQAQALEDRAKAREFRERTVQAERRTELRRAAAQVNEEIIGAVKKAS